MNEIPKAKGKSIWRRVADEFRDGLVQMLLVTAAISAGFRCVESDCFFDDVKMTKKKNK